MPNMSMRNRSGELVAVPTRKCGFSPGNGAERSPTGRFDIMRIRGEAVRATLATERRSGARCRAEQPCSRLRACQTR